ncbi:hypothetical protein HPB47_001902 [Ixodes persulcatus]|uniref:Uncharacterized protein n=1 Tax=Ixodes persulcatus TaxID=34615 RepID=A0AC60PMP8_IXOPE|nr:hypothetical protein HPB47_001902 [Ixodes persulcatus]
MDSSNLFGQATIGATRPLIRRVNTRHRELREADTLRLVQAFAISRVVYVAPCMNLLKAEQARLETTIRKVTETALHLPALSSTQRPMKMGAHNALTELVKAHRVNQLFRLGKTPSGRPILSQLNLTPIHVEEGSRKSPPHRKSLIDVRPLPITSSRYIITDSQDACRAYLCGLICPEAHYILDTHQRREGKRTISIICTSSHTETEVKGNARAHHLAREEADARAMVSDLQPDPPTSLTNTNKNITTFYREQRRTLPPPHHTLDKREQGACSKPTLTQRHPDTTRFTCPKHPKPHDAARLQNRFNSWERPSEPQTRRIIASRLS